MAQTINTRIVLRNDSTTAWLENSQQVLYKGEVGIEFLAGGRVKVKVGDGTTTWEKLPYVGNRVVEMTNPGLSFDEFAQETWPNPIDGDMIIEVKAIPGKAAKDGIRTAYIFDKKAAGSSASGWVALSGNVNAENVYFTKDLVTTNAIGQIKLENGQATVPAAGKNLAELWETIFVKENNGVVTQPSASLSASDTYIEVGSSANVTATVSYEDGKYEFGHTGSKVARDGSHIDITVNEATGATAETYNIQYNEKRVNIGNESSISVDSGIETAKTSKAISASVSYTDGFLPVSNLGNVVAGNQIKAGTADAGSKKCFYWYVPMFKGFTYSDSIIADLANITNEQVTKLEKVSGITAYNQTVPTSDSASKSWRQYIVAVPASYGKKQPTAKDSNNLTLNVKKANDVTIKLGTASIAYNVYYISNAADYDTLTISLAW